MVGHGIRLLDDGVHCRNFRFHRVLAGENLVDLLIAGLCDLGQPIPQMVHCIGDVLALVAFDLTLMRDGGQPLFAAPISLQQIVGGAPLVYR